MLKKSVIRFLIFLLICVTLFIGGCGGGGGGGDDDGTGNPTPIGDVKLDVPFVENYGNTCVASSFTMLLKYLFQNVTFEEIFDIFGLPPFNNYEYPTFCEWVKIEFDVDMYMYSYCTIDDIIRSIDYGYPVMAHQQFTLEQKTGHMRVVIGYNIEDQLLILNDPSNLGKDYRMSFELFEILWQKITEIENTYPNKLFLLLPNSESSPIVDGNGGLFCP